MILDILFYLGLTVVYLAVGYVYLVEKRVKLEVDKPLKKPYNYY